MPYRFKCDCCEKKYIFNQKDVKDVECSKCGMRAIRRDWKAEEQENGFN